MAKEPLFIMLTGLPASGKSTLRAVVLDTCNFNGSHIHSSDDYIETAAAKCGATYSEVFADTIKISDRIFKYKLKEALLKNEPILIDRTNLTPKSRARILSQVPGHYHKIALYVEVFEEVRQQRLASRVGKEIPKNIDDSMKASYSRPTLDEGFNGVYHPEVFLEIYWR